jgi:hypothetical protein
MIISKSSGETFEQRKVFHETDIYLLWVCWEKNVLFRPLAWKAKHLILGFCYGFMTSCIATRVWNKHQRQNDDKIFNTDMALIYCIKNYILTFSSKTIFDILSLKCFYIHWLLRYYRQYKWNQMTHQFIYAMPLVNNTPCRIGK